jgi:plastocyanin
MSRKRERSTMNRITSIAALSLLASTAAADTTQTGPNEYTVDAGVTFTIQSQGSSNYLFNWTDSSGTYSNVIDPTITLSSGETYVFDNQTFSHPLRITNDTMPVSGTDGNFTRNTSDINVINNASLQPIADFTADPQPANDPITWTPAADDAGEYFYTCLVLSHASMTGKLIVAAPPACPADLTGDGKLNFFDVSAFLNAYNAMDPAADFTGDGIFNFFDVSAFLNAYNAGCP